MIEFLKSLKKFAWQSVASTETLIKVGLLSRRSRKSKSVDGNREIIILGNGPSLRTTMAEDWDYLMSVSRMAVNYSAVSEDFWRLKPDYYTMIDPVLFPSPQAEDSLSGDLWRELQKVDWPMKVFVPSERYARSLELIGKNETVKILPVNITPLEGFKWLTHRLIRRGKGMPRPRNVMIASIIAAMGEGFGKIRLAGADHSWTRTLSIDKENNVCNVVAHFYEEKRVEQEEARIIEAYRGIHLHDVLESLRITFNSYFDIRDYADWRGVEIVNVSPGSMIDAFEHERLSDLR